MKRVNRENTNLRGVVAIEGLFALVFILLPLFTMAYESFFFSQAHIQLTHLLREGMVSAMAAPYGSFPSSTQNVPSEKEYLHCISSTCEEKGCKGCGATFVQYRVLRMLSSSKANTFLDNPIVSVKAEEVGSELEIQLRISGSYRNRTPLGIGRSIDVTEKGIYLGKIL
jgi:hypothetical protein